MAGRKDSANVANAGSACMTIASNEALSRVTARSSCLSWPIARCTRMSRRLQTTRGRSAPSAAAASSNGTSSNSNFRRPNGYISISSTAGRASSSAASSSSARRAQACSTGYAGSWLTSLPSASWPSGGRLMTLTPAGTLVPAGNRPPLSSRTSNRSVRPSASRSERARWPRPSECWQ